MKHLIEIDDSSETGKSILSIIKSLTKTSKSVAFKKIEDIELIIDQKLGKKIESGLKTDDVSRSEVMKVLSGK